MTDEELLTAKKIAENIGVPVKRVNQYLEQEEIEPDKTKGSCKYYGAQKQAQIKKALS